MDVIEYAKRQTELNVTERNLRMGVVTGLLVDMGKVTIQLGGDTTDVQARYLGSYTPVLNDTVIVYVEGADVLVLGTTVRATGRDFTTDPLTNSELAVNAVDIDNIIDGAVARVKIAEAAINEALLEQGAITETKISDDAVTTLKIKSNSIVTSHIQARQVDASKIVAGTITANEILSRTITADRIKANEISANEISGKSITADEIATGSLTSASGVFGTISADDITTGTLNANDVTVNGDVISGGTISGVSLSIGSNFSVTSTGVLTATSGTFSGSITGASGIFSSTVRVDASVSGVTHRVQVSGGRILVRRGTTTVGSILAKTDESGSTAGFFSVGYGLQDFSSPSGNRLQMNSNGIGIYSGIYGIGVSGTTTSVNGTLTVGGNLNASNSEVRGSDFRGRTTGGGRTTPIFMPSSNHPQSGMYGLSTTGELRFSHDGYHCATIRRGGSNQGAVEAGDLLATEHGTTTESANVFIFSSSGRLARSTSLAATKTDVEDLDPSYADRVLDLRPVFYRSLASLDSTERSHYGLIAEEVDEVEPRLAARDPDSGDLIGVQYDRVPVLLLSVVQRLVQRVETLEKGNL